MKISKQARRDAKALFQSCKVNGLVDESRVRQAVDEVIAGKPRGYVAILQYFHRLVKLAAANRAALVESAVPLTPEMQNSISANLGAKHGGGLNIRFEVNPGVIGGLRIRVGSDVYDSSVATRLAELQSSF